MKWDITDADMSHTKEHGFVGKVLFTIEGHRTNYEVTLHSTKGKEWSYSLNFARDSGIEKEIEAAEALLEEDDDFFDALVEAARSKLQQP
ncbi:hypothetical protein [Paenibacillus oceani]|uniref:Uncharacterized protein n=1 Tax=Paenibacillus oceani TaxID=2772510 RepID=A0A927C388_9BACL|nr:hypothetical protein [Paenibacillus oceani]MBD2860503.1 hypothetical protein [Paenibacillus oceani]